MSKSKGSNKEELKRLILDRNAFEPMVDKTFKDTDINKNGYIEKNELASLLKTIYASIGLPPPPIADIEKELKRLDKNGDKKISKEEFKILVRDLCLYFIDQVK